MIDLYPDHCEVVRNSLSGARVVDEQTFASVAALDERLRHVKKLGAGFSRVEFSPAVRHIKAHQSKVAVG